MPDLRTYTLRDYTVPDPDGCREVSFARPLTVTVGTHALEPGVTNGITLMRFSLLSGNPLLEQFPKMRMRVLPKKDSTGHQPTSISFDDPLLVELLFDNSSFLSERKEMPFWLVEALEFAAHRLREQYALNQNGGLAIEQVD